MRWNSVASTNQTTKWMTNGLWFYICQRQEIFSSPQTSRLALGLSQPPIQLVTKNTPRVKQSGHGAYQSPHLMPTLWISEPIPVPSCIFMTCVKTILPCWLKKLEEKKRTRNYRSTNHSVVFGFHWTNNMDSFQFSFFENNWW